ncbi:MAG: M20/M25/M40 family metallo-hydrolase [Polyangiaceae bacterium]|nr:M20/M25/M40 family metallo-hydrolase [Polyangiaceae bacterium]
MPALTPGVEDRVREHVRVLASEIGERNLHHPGALAAARDYLARELEGMGHSVTPQRYAVGGAPCENLEVALPGADEGRETLVLGAHYDSALGTPGADDNASAVAALLEIARALRGVEPRGPVRLVAYVNEEPPYSFSPDMGSRVHAAACHARGERVRMVALEMLGYYSDAPRSQKYPPVLRHFHPDRGNFIGFVSDRRSRAWLQEVFAAFRAGSDFPSECSATFGWLPGIGWSDHSSYWHFGYPALMVTDTAFFRNPNYHSPRDRCETLDYPRLARVTEGLAGAVARLVA